MIFNSDATGRSSVDLYIGITFLRHDVYQVFVRKQAQ